MSPSSEIVEDDSVIQPDEAVAKSLIFLPPLVGAMKVTTEVT